MIHTIHKIDRPARATASGWRSARARKREAVAQSERDAASADTYVAIPEASSKFALFAPPVFLVWHKLWWALAVYALLGALAIGLFFTAYLAAALALGGFPALYLYLEGHELRRRRLERNGAPAIAVVDGQDEEHAIASYLQKRDDDEQPAAVPAQMPAAAARQPAREAQPSFGMFADVKT